MIYMDADIQVFRNIDSLFDLPSGCFYAVVNCLCDMDDPCPEVVQWPRELGNQPSFYFNAGMFVLEPSLHTYSGLLSTLYATPPTQFAEQVTLEVNCAKLSRYSGKIEKLVLTRLHSQIVYNIRTLI